VYPGSSTCLGVYLGSSTCLARSTQDVGSYTSTSLASSTCLLS
jgi:hypothetical protein